MGRKRAELRIWDDRSNGSAPLVFKGGRKQVLRNYFLYLRKNHERKVRVEQKDWERFSGELSEEFDEFWQSLFGVNK